MATYSNLKFITGVAGEDLSDKQSRLVKFDGTSFTVCEEGDPAFGVVFGGAANGGFATVIYKGTFVVEAGGTFSAGDSLQSDSQGRVVTQTGTNPIVGVALSDGVLGQKVQVQFVGLSGNGESSSPVATATRVVSIWGQSEIFLLTADFYNGTPDTFVNSGSGSVTIYWHNRGPSGSAGVEEVLVSSSTSNSRFVAMANSLLAVEPNTDWHIALHAVSGTGFEELLIDSQTTRDFADEVALHDYVVTAAGKEPDIAGFSWYAEPRGYGGDYGEVLHQMAFGKTVAGSSIGSTPASIAGEFTADHLLTEIYDWTATKLVVLEPHRFEPTNSGNIANCRTGVRSMYDSSSETALVQPNHPVLHYGNGRTDGAGGWTDITHPSPGDGSERFGVGLVQSIIRALGVTSWTPPVIDNVYWHPDGTYVEIWSSAGPIVSNTTPVVGMFIDGSPVDATIVSGRLRATAPGGSPYTSSTTLTFSPDSTGLTLVSEIEDGWDQYPLVDLSVPGMPDGVPIASAPTADLSSTIAGASFFAAGTTIGDPDNYPAATSGITYRIKMRPDTGETRHLLLSGTSVPALDYLTADGGSFELRILDSGGSVIGTIDTGSGVAPVDAFFTVTVRVDLAAGEAELWVGESGSATRYSTTFTSSGAMPTNRNQLLMNAQSSGDVEYVEYWRSTSTFPSTGPDLGDYDETITWVDGSDGIGEPRRHFYADGTGTRQVTGTSVP
jgi:hypothetical protein